MEISKAIAAGDICNFLAWLVDGAKVYEPLMPEARLIKAINIFETPWGTRFKRFSGIAKTYLKVNCKDEQTNQAYHQFFLNRVNLNRIVACT